MKEHSPNRNPGQIALEEVCEVIADPPKLPDFLAAHRMSGKFYRIADEHHRDVHGLARTVIQAIDSARNRDELVNALKATTNLRKTNDLVALVLDALIEYHLPKDAYFRTCDKCIQRHLENLDKDGAEIPAFIRSLGGIRGTYDAYRDAKGGNARKEKKARANLEAAVLQACPGLGEGDYVAIVARALKGRRLQLESARVLCDATPRALIEAAPLC